MRATLPLVVGVILPPQLSYFNSMSVCFTVWVIAGLGLFPCVLTLNSNRGLSSDQSHAALQVYTFILFISHLCKLVWVYC